MARLTIKQAYELGDGCGFDVAFDPAIQDVDDMHAQALGYKNYADPDLVCYMSDGIYVLACTNILFAKELKALAYG